MKTFSSTTKTRTLLFAVGSLLAGCIVGASPRPETRENVDYQGMGGGSSAPPHMFGDDAAPSGSDGSSGGAGSPANAGGRANAGAGVGVASMGAGGRPVVRWAAPAHRAKAAIPRTPRPIAF